MNITLVKALIALVPVSVLVVWSIAAFFRTRTTGMLLQTLGIVCLVIVVLTHVAEALNVLPFMQWGNPHSAGHYLDLSSILLGITLVPIGYILHRHARRA